MFFHFEIFGNNKKMADDKSKDLKVVICIADTEDLPFGEFSVPLFFASPAQSFP